MKKIKKNKISKNWIQRQRRDIFVKESKIQGYRSRAVFKLKEINEKFDIIKNNSIIIDLGAAPGSWSQYLSRETKNSKIICIDVNVFEKIQGTEQIIGDFFQESSKEKIRKIVDEKVDSVLSDMAVNTTGNKTLDSITTNELGSDAMNFALEILRDKGSFVAKIFMGQGFNEIISSAKKSFKEVKVFKPQSSRKESKENFIVCKKLR